MLLGLFNTTLDAKAFTDKHGKKVGDRIIILGDDQTTYERTGESWKNINGIFLIGPTGEKGEDGIDGKNGIDIDQKKAENSMYEKIRKDEGFIKRTKGDIGKTGKTGQDGKSVVINDIINIIYPEIIQKLVDKLIENDLFINSLKGKDGKDGTSTNGIDGKDGKDGKDGVDGKDGYDGENGSYINVVAEITEWIWGPKDIVIDYDKNIYYWENNGIKKIAFITKIN